MEHHSIRLYLLRYPIHNLSRLKPGTFRAPILLWKSGYDKKLVFENLIEIDGLLQFIAEQSIDAGMKALTADGIDLTDGADGLGVEVDTTSETPTETPLPNGLAIPVIPNTNLSPQQRGANTRKANAAAAKVKS